MLHTAYAALGVNSWWWHGEIERDDLTLCFSNDGRVVDEKERDGDEAENDMEDTSQPEKSGVRLAWLGSEDLVSMLLPAGSGPIRSVLGMVNWLAHEIL